MNALEGIRVLELCRVSPAELPGMMLADFGADVIKVDAPVSETSDPASDRRAVHAHTNRNKRAIALDLKSKEGAHAFAALARSADVVIEGFRPGVMARLGFDYEALSAANPRLVMCSLSAFGQDGPWRERPAHDLNFLALSGALALWGRSGRPPDIPLNLVADLGGAAMHATAAIAFALLARDRDGRGQYLDMAYLDATVALLAATPNLRRDGDGGSLPRPDEGVFSGLYPYYALYATADKRWLSVACSEPHLWSNFCTAIKRPDLRAHARRAEHYHRTANADELAARAEVQSIILMHSLAYWTELLSDSDICIAPVLTTDELLQSSHAQGRGLVTGVHHPREGIVPQFSSALRLSRTPASIGRAAPLPGEHTGEVLRELGIDHDPFEQTPRQAQAIQGDPDEDFDPPP